MHTYNFKYKTTADVNITLKSKTTLKQEELKTIINFIKSGKAKVYHEPVLDEEYFFAQRIENSSLVLESKKRFNILCGEQDKILKLDIEAFIERF